MKEQKNTISSKNGNVQEYFNILKQLYSHG